jgi:hypothetical protein
MRFRARLHERVAVERQRRLDETAAIVAVDAAADAAGQSDAAAASDY